MPRRHPGLTAAALLFASGALVTPLDAQSLDAESLRGSWTAERYLLAGGAEHEVRGQIHFTRSDWLVLFFVMEGSRPARGSAEGGRYAIEDGTLTFEHLHHLSAGEALDGLPESPLRLETRDEGALEPTRVEVDGPLLTLLFPSGNRMTFRRSARP